MKEKVCDGYCEFLCTKGHRWSEPETYDSSDYGPCRYCGSKVAWGHLINEADGLSFGIIPDSEWAKFEIEPESEVICNYGHAHILRYARYRPPTKSEFERVIHFWNETDQRFQTVASGRARYGEQIHPSHYEEPIHCNS